MSLVREITGYATSKDYEKLFEVAQNQSIICLCKWGMNKDYPCTDIAHTLCDKNNIEVSARGTGYITAFGIDDFIEQCKQCDLEWIPPKEEPTK